MQNVDILIPTYNPRPEHLTAALQSLQAQTSTSWRAFIHDDCSPKGETAAIVQPFLADPRITYRQSPVRLGIGGNWNACLRQTNAPIVAYLFQDDLWFPTYIERAQAMLERHPTAGFVSMEHDYKTEGGMTTPPLYAAVQDFRRRYVAPGLHRGTDILRFWIAHELHPNIIREPSFVVLRRSVMEKAGPFLEDMPQFLDSEYWLRLLSLCDWVNDTEASYGTFRVHPSAASAVNQMTGQGLFDRLRCFERLRSLLHGVDRRAVIAARNHALVSMTRKFFARRTQAHGPQKKGYDKRWILGFCLRHPLLMTCTILRAMQREKAKE